MKSDFQVSVGNGSHRGIGSGVCSRKPATEDGVGKQPPASPPRFPAVFPGGNALPRLVSTKGGLCQKGLRTGHFCLTWNSSQGSPVPRLTPGWDFFRMACSLSLLSLPLLSPSTGGSGAPVPSPFFIDSLGHIRFHLGSYSRTLKLALRFIGKPINSHSSLLGSWNFRQVMRPRFPQL